MAGTWMARGLAAMVVAALACGMALTSTAHAQGQNELTRLLADVSRLHDQGKSAEAIPMAERAVSVAREHYGEEHAAFATAMEWLANLYQAQGRYSEAEPLHKRSLVILEKARGPEHLDVATVLSSLAALYRDRGRYAEAEPLYQRSLAIREKALGPEHPAMAQALNNVAGLYRLQGRYAEAEPLYKRSLAIREKARGLDHPDVATALNGLAAVYRAQGHYAEAEQLLRRSLAIREKALGPEHRAVGIALNYLGELYKDLGRYAEAEPLLRRSLAIHERSARLPEDPWVGTALNSLAELNRAQGRYAEAEPLLRRSLAVREKALGPEHQDVGTVLNNLAALYRVQERNTEAEPLLKRSLAIWEKALGPEHPDVGTSLVNLAALLRAQRRNAEAEPLLRRSLAIYEKALGPEHSWVGTVLNHLAELLRAYGRYAEAEPLVRRSLAIHEKALGPEHPAVASALANLADQYRVHGRYAEAEPLLKRSLTIYEKALGPDHPDVAGVISALAALAYIQHDWSRAADYWRQSTGIIKRRAERGFAEGRDDASGGEAQRLASRFWGLVKATHRLALQGSGPSVGQTVEAFETAQWALGSEAAASLAQMAARSAKGSPELAGLVRERQDLVGEWQAKDKLLIAAKSEEPAKRKAHAEKVLADRLATIDTRLAEINGRLALDFPDYAALASPAPVSVADVQAQLGADEALVLFLDTPERRPLPEETFIWVVTKSSVRWVRSELGTAALTREVTALRCGLDTTAWDGGAEKCAKALGISLDKAPGPHQPLPFDHARAHKLYSALFGEVQDLIKGKHLLIVPSGALTQLPFQVLVTKAPSSADHRAAAWLTRDHAVTVLPAVSSIRALRRVSRPSTASRPMIGFGNPLLDGPDARYSSFAKLARDKQGCRDVREQQTAVLDVPRAGLLRLKTRGGLADVSHIKEQIPLHETADELCAVAQDVKAEAGRDIFLGAKATEREIKRLSASGELAKYRMVHFATHGFLSGQLEGTHEPGLILTPPDQATEEDDGYLSASEIAALKLDADWVILSACNTAAGAANSAEALSGLARAFMYAQARALLVSHWEVNSDGTVKLITAAIREMARDPKVGRSEALRRSMLALIDKGEPHEAHPAYWAPFVVVGEGAAGR
jgi:CHAT domain-containing protein/tetratricopeptide (TPR) repeat protein